MRLLIVLAALLGVAHGVAQYHYGIGNDVSILPVVLRVMDPGYLSNDFYVNTAAQFGPRLYFAQLLARLATPDTLPVFYFVLNIVANFGTALVAGLFARALFHGSNLAAICGAFAVMAATTFELGYTAQFGRAEFTPSAFVQPLLVAALWAGFRGRPFACVLAGVPAALIHPVLGPEATALGLWMAFVAILARHGFAVVRRHAAGLVAGLIVLAVAMALSVARYWPSVDLDARRFIEIESVFRAPHHTLATFFPLSEYAAAICFFVATAIAWQRWRRDGRTTPAEAFSIASVLVALVVSCLAGYVFVEIVPVRLVAIARPFKMLLLAKLLGVLLVAGWLARLLENPGRKDHRYDAALLAAGLLSPFVLVVATALLAARARLQGWVPWISRPGIGALVVALSPLLLMPPDPVDAARLVVFGCLTATLLVFGNRPIVVASVAALTLAVSAALFVEVERWPRFARGYARQLKPQLSFADLPGSEADAARWAARHTPADARFLVPPSHGTFRLVAQRAIVVDFKSIPYQDRAMVEWQGRLLDCCGPVPEGTIGFAAARVMDQNYGRLRDAELTRLADRYEAAYAVLFRSNVTARPVVHANERLKIVRLAPSENVE